MDTGQAWCATSTARSTRRRRPSARDITATLKATAKSRDITALENVQTCVVRNKCFLCETVDLKEQDRRVMDVVTVAMVSVESKLPDISGDRHVVTGSTTLGSARGGAVEPDAVGCGATHTWLR